MFLKTATETMKTEAHTHTHTHKTLKHKRKKPVKINEQGKCCGMISNGPEEKENVEVEGGEKILEAVMVEIFQIWWKV